jgi:Co/Zn/Cd efflux system component
LEVADDKVSDFHLWRLGPGHLGAIISIVSDNPQPPQTYKRRLASFPELSHVTVEVERCANHHAKAA